MSCSTSSTRLWWWWWWLGWNTMLAAAVLLGDTVMVVGAEHVVHTTSIAGSSVQEEGPSFSRADYLAADSPVTMAPFVDKIAANPLLNGDGSSSSSGSTICAQVKNVFATRQLKTAIHLIPDIPHNGHDLEVCTSHSSCCSKELVQRFPEAIVHDFLGVLQATSAFYKDLFASTVAKSQDSFLAMVRTSENNTNSLFSEIYKRMALEAQPLIQSFYGGLSDFLKGKDVDLEETVTGFFDGLFPLVYHHSINPKLNDFNKDYKECLQETQAEIRPFGDTPKLILALVSRSFQASRTFLDALNLGVEVINTTDHVEIAAECKKSLINLLYCPVCQGLVDARSCIGYCMNIVSGCLANVAEIELLWHDYVVALEKLATSLKDGAILEDVTSSLGTKISEAIMYAMENGPELSKKVKGACGHPKRNTRDVPVAVPFTNATNRNATFHSISPLLRSQLQTFVQSLVKVKEFYRKLTTDLCADDTLTVKGEGSCWNGEALGGYKKTIAGSGLSAQKYNPELNLQHWRDSKTAQLNDKLKHMRQIIISRTVTLPESDSLFINDGSGSGWPYRGISGDDEDYHDGSGSGYESEEEEEGVGRSGSRGGDGSNDDINFNTEPGLEAKTTNTQKATKSITTVKPYSGSPISVIESWSTMALLLILCGCVHVLNG